MARQFDSRQKPVFKGDLLLCEDNIINRLIIQPQLLELGFDVTVAGNGEEGVSHVFNRMRDDDKPFDLIFMDIYMPVMDGLEAVDALNELGCQTPVVALSASERTSDREVCKAHGMIDFLNKPFTPYELWSCLCHYLTPVRFEASEDEARAVEEAKQRHKLLTSFVKKNQTTFADICTAINRRDYKLAHRLAHTLRGLAGLMDEDALQVVARAVEQSLADAKLVDINAQLFDLEREMNAVLDKLAPLLYEQKTQPTDRASFDKAKAVELLDRLEPLLQKDSAMSVKLAEELRAIPETDALIEQVEDYEFEMALVTLTDLRKTLGL